MSSKKNLITILSVFGITSIRDHGIILMKLENGIDVNATDSDGRTLLMEAAIKNDHELIKLLISKGADVTVSDNRQWTALHFAAQEYDVVSTKLLIEAGANVNALNDFGNSVLSTAVFNSMGRGDVIQLLVKSGADAGLKNHFGTSALDLAKTISNYDVLQFLS